MPGGLYSRGNDVLPLEQHRAIEFLRIEGGSFRSKLQPSLSELDFMTSIRSIALPYSAFRKAEEISDE